MKSVCGCAGIYTIHRRSPHGERGLKLQAEPVTCRDYVSLPPRGAWIEIPWRSAPWRSAPRRSPHGERGLKYFGAGGELSKIESLPPRGAWIEIHQHVRLILYGGRSPHGERGLKCTYVLALDNLTVSLPPRGAWIEIFGPTKYTHKIKSLPPRGAWIEIAPRLYLVCWPIVAPPTGSVD